MVDLYWKCYAYGDELKPHIEFLDGIMLSSTRDITPSCVENVDELIERQEKSLVQLDTKRHIVLELIEKGRLILANPDKPKFLERHVKQIEEGWEETKTKAKERLTLLQDTKEAWVGYAENNDTIATEFEKAKDEIQKVKKKFNLEAAFGDLAKRQKIYADTKTTIEGIFAQITNNVDVMSLTIPEDKKKNIEKEKKAVEEKLAVLMQFKETVDVVDKFCNELREFDSSLKSIDSWMLQATKELEDIKNSSDKMPPEDRVARTMDLQEDIAAKMKIIKASIETELNLLPQGEKVPQDAQAHKDEADCGLNIKVLEAANAAAVKMTTHKDSDAEVAALRERYVKVKGVADAWVKKVDTLVKEWTLLDNTVTELNSWVAKDKTSEGENQFSLEKMESTLGELKTIFKQKESLVDNL